MREERFRCAGLEYFKIVGLDLLEVETVVDRMLATRDRALWLPEDGRAWTLQAPPDWYESPLDLMTLDERMEHRTSIRGLPVPT